MKNILILAAHPDDETLGLGSTISRLKSEGAFIRLLTFTDGEGARDDASNLNRNTKLDQISEILGIDSFEYGNFPDNAMDSVPLLELAKFIEQNKGMEPDVIFTHHGGDLNIDHQLVYQATLTAFRPQTGHPQEIYSYYVPSSTDFNPNNNFSGNNLYVILSKEDVDKKIEALQVYDAEMRDYPHTRSYGNVKGLLSVWGSEIGAEYAEKFKTIRQVI